MKSYFKKGKYIFVLLSASIFHRDWQEIDVSIDMSKYIDLPDKKHYLSVVSRYTSSEYI